jgi:hypothetical protein
VKRAKLDEQETIFAAKLECVVSREGSSQFIVRIVDRGTTIVVTLLLSNNYLHREGSRHSDHGSQKLGCAFY